MPWGGYPCPVQRPRVWGTWGSSAAGPGGLGSLGAAVVGPGPLLLGRMSPSLAALLGGQDPQAWFFAPGGMGSEALGVGARVWALGLVAHGPGNKGMGI